MLKQYNFRISPTDIKELDKLGGCRSEHIRIAIRGYLQNDIQNNSNYDQDIFKDYIEELKEDKRILQKRLDYFMLPWYQKVLLPKPKTD